MQMLEMDELTTRCRPQQFYRSDVEQVETDFVLDLKHFKHKLHLRRSQSLSQMDLCLCKCS